MKTKSTLLTLSAASLLLGGSVLSEPEDAHAASGLHFNELGTAGNVRAELLGTDPFSTLAEKDGSEEKCGEDKCGEDKCGEDKCGEGSCG